MIRTDFATQMAAPAGAARPCGDFGHGYQWRNRMAMNVNSLIASRYQAPCPTPREAPT